MFHNRRKVIYMTTNTVTRRRRRSALDIVIGQVTGGIIFVGTGIIFLAANGYIAF
jgi:hypothetical protein